MSIVRLIGSAALFVIVVVILAGEAWSQEHYWDAQPAVGVSDASLYSLMRRLEVLETSMNVREPSSAGLTEVNTVQKPTVNVSGRIHLDYWGFPDASPLANFLDTDNAAVLYLAMIARSVSNPMTTRSMITPSHAIPNMTDLTVGSAKTQSKVSGANRPKIVGPRITPASNSPTTGG